MARRMPISVVRSLTDAYPPGIPVLAPGEIVDRQAVNGIKSMIDSGLNVAGVNDGYIKVLCGE